MVYKRLGQKNQMKQFPFYMWKPKKKKSAIEHKGQFPGVQKEGRAAPRSKRMHTPQTQESQVKQTRCWKGLMTVKYLTGTPSSDTKKKPRRSNEG